MLNTSVIALITLLVLLLGTLMACMGNDTGNWSETSAKVLRWVGGIIMLGCCITTIILKIM